MIRAIIVDDEYLARQRVINLLQQHDEIKIIGECKNGQQAVDTILSKEPDLVFLDIQMPDFDGFEVISRINSRQSPYIIFTTAYDSYAIKAFDVHALDYLLKPIDEDRFNETVNKTIAYFNVQKSANFNHKLVGLLNAFQKESSTFKSRFSIKEKGREIVIDAENIGYVEANGNYINLVTSEKTYLYRTTMGTVYNQLNPDQFIRIHRSYIVNKTFIEQCQYLNNNEYKFILKNGENLISGRSYNDLIMKYVSD